MRIDKFLKSSRIIKRRPVAKEACDQGRVLLNNTVAKPGDNIEVGDIIEVAFGTGELKVEVVKLLENARKDQADTMYKVL